MERRKKEGHSVLQGDNCCVSFLFFHFGSKTGDLLSGGLFSSRASSLFSHDLPSSGPRASMDMHVRVYTHTRTYMCMCIYTCTCVYMCTRLCVEMRVFVCYGEGARVHSPV